jgi:hypothetical protein
MKIGIKQTISQGGSTRLARPRLKRTDFIAKWIAERGSFHIDGEGPDYRAAVKLAAADPTLEIVESGSVVAGRVIPGWQLRRAPC